MLLSNGSWNVVVLYTHTFRDDEHLTHEMQIKGKYLVFSFLSISKRQERAKCLEQKKKDDSIREDGRCRCEPSAN
jgi:hypothetical protein